MPTVHFGTAFKVEFVAKVEVLLTVEVEFKEEVSLRGKRVYICDVLGKAMATVATQAKYVAIWLIEGILMISRIRYKVYVNGDSIWNHKIDVLCFEN